VLDGTGTGMWEWRVGEDRVRWSPSVGPMFGLQEGESPASFEEYLELVHPDDRARLQSEVRQALESGQDYNREFRTRWADGTVRWLSSRAHVLSGEDGAPAAIVGLIADTTERRLRALAAEFLARAGTVLAESLAVEPTLERVAQLAVPELADWCSVSLASEGGGVENVAVAHQDPARVALAREFSARYPTDPDSPTGVAAVLRTGKTELYPAITEEVLSAASDQERLAFARELGLGAAMIVPMPARGRVLGAITFVAAESGRTFDAADVELAEELGRRAGLAIDNVRLYELAQGTAETLQRSLLPDRLPDTPRLETAARYLPGMAGADVGGDWYDVIELPSGAAAIVVGDVMGRGVKAAALMGQLRTAVRSYALIAPDPGATMRLVSDYVTRRGDVDFATVLLLTVDPQTGAIEACSAGHLPPVLVPADGPAELLTLRQGPPLGIAAHPYETSRVDPTPGVSLLLYTDGLVERRRVPLDDGLQRLVEVCSDGPREPGALVDHVLRGLLAGDTSDDVAVLAVRALPG
jgi:PAS domain S-box-containing protein